MDFHGTMSERRWEDKVIYPYVKQAMGEFLKANWADETVQKCVPTLRDESFEQRFRNKFDDAPVISDPVNGEDELDQNQLAAQVSEFLLWQMSGKKETSETHLIERLVWRDGLKRRQIFTPIYEDVFRCVRDWHDKSACAIYVVSSLDPDTLRLLFETTDKGNLYQYLRGFLTPKRPGDKMSTELYSSFYERLYLHRSPPHSPSQRSQIRTPSSPPSSSAVAQQGCHVQTINGVKTSPSQDSVSRPILFLTDSGQEARAASHVNEGTAFECILVDRPGNKRFRSYYLSQFPYIERFDDVGFLQ